MNADRRAELRQLAEVAGGELQLLDAIARVEAQLDEWDRLSKGETPTTARIRAAINGGPS